MKFDYYKYSIAGHYLSALINGDESAMTPIDIDWLNAFYRELPPVNGHWDVIDNEASFMRDDISGLAADCYECRYYFPI